MTISSGHLLIVRDYMEYLKKIKRVDNDMQFFRGLSMEEIKNYLNSFGMQIVENKTTYHDDVPNKFSNELQKMYFSYAITEKPLWYKEAWQGKQIAKLCMYDMSIGCLDQLFLKGDTEGEKYWWSKLINHSRSLMQGENEETGLKGENLISELEKNRTGLDPYDAYIYNTRAGYDIQSVISKDNREKIFIEVKTTIGIFKNMVAHIYRNQINKSREYKNYFFYFVSLKEKSFYKFHGKDIAKHCPHDQLDGRWEKFELPFVALINDGTKSLKKENLENIHS